LIYQIIKLVFEYIYNFYYNGYIQCLAFPNPTILISLSYMLKYFVRKMSPNIQAGPYGSGISRGIKAPIHCDGVP
jgi:hypothetical protein